MLKYGDKDLRKRWMGTTNINTIHLGTTNIWPYITNTSVGDWVLTVTPSKTSISAAGETITITVTGKRTTTYTWVNFVGTTTTRYKTTADETLTDYAISSSIGTVSGNNITVPYNPNTSNRNIVVTVTTNDGYSETVTIVQNKNAITYSDWSLTFTASPTTIAAEGGTSTLNGKCTRTYTNSNGQGGGTETATVTYSTTVGTINSNTLTIPANAGNSRNIIVTATSQGLSKTVTLTQAAATATAGTLKIYDKDMNLIAYSTPDASDGDYSWEVTSLNLTNDIVGYLEIINGPQNKSNIIISPYSSDGYHRVNGDSVASVYDSVYGSVKVGEVSIGDLTNGKFPILFSRTADDYKGFPSSTTGIIFDLSTDTDDLQGVINFSQYDGTISLWGDYDDIANNVTTNNPNTLLRVKNTITEDNVVWYQVTEAICNIGSVSIDSQDGNVVWSGEANNTGADRVIVIVGKTELGTFNWKFTQTA